jgi:hypothetical protein
MSAIVDYSFYSTVYMGTEADQASFPALCARALDVVGAMTRWAVTEETFAALPAPIQTLYKKAICSQADFFAVNGLDSVAIAGAGGVDNGFTVGKVSVHGRSGASTYAGGMVGNIAPMAKMYLEQTGLLNPAVDAGPLYAELDGWWL